MNFAHRNYNHNNNSLPQQLPVPAVLVLSVPATIIILLTVFGNLLVLFFKARVGRTNTTLLVWNLGLTDFLVGVFVLPMGAVYLLNRRWTFGHVLCRIWVGADVTFCTCSVVTICIISVDRYLAVTRPLRYKTVVTKFKVIFVIILIWAFSFGILLATVRWESHSKTKENKTCFVGDEIRYLAHSVVFAFFLPASVTLTLYWRIYSLARDRQKALDRGFLMILGHNMNFLTNTLTQATALRVHIGKNNGMVEHQRRVLRTHERIAKTLGVVSCSFLFCWLPFFTLYLLNNQCHNCIPTLIIDIASWLGYCNSMLNPIIYSFTVKEFKRSAFCVLLPIWQSAHRWLPKIVNKPPDRKTTHRIVRKRQQITSTPRSKITLPGQTSMLYMERKRKTPHSKERSNRARNGAIASLMINANSSIAQNALTSAAMKSGGKTKNESSKGSTGTKQESNEDNWLKVNGFDEHPGPKRSLVVLGENANKIAQRLRVRRRSSLDELEDVRKFAEGGDFLFNRSGFITTTLLLATSETIYGEQQLGSGKMGTDDANSLPLSNSFSSSLGSDLASSHKSIRMPCKMSLKKLKRHSLPEVADTQPYRPAAVRKISKQRKRAIKAGHRKALFAAFLRKSKTERKISTNDENEAEAGKGSSTTGGLWKRARQIMKMSGSSSQGSLASRKKKNEGERGGEKETIEAEEGINGRGESGTNPNRDEQFKIICTTDETPL